MGGSPYKGLVAGGGGGRPGGSVREASNFWLRLRSCGGELEPCIRLCADSSGPAACFGFCASLCLCPSPAHTVCLRKMNKPLKTQKKKHLRGAWVAKLTVSAQVVISRSVGSCPASGSLLAARGLLGILSPPLSLHLPHLRAACSRSHSFKNKHSTKHFNIEFGSISSPISISCADFLTVAVPPFQSPLAASGALTKGTECGSP